MRLELVWREGWAYIHGTAPDGKRVRKSAKTRDPVQAEAQRSALEATLWKVHHYGPEAVMTFGAGALAYFNHRDALLYVGVSFSPLMRDEAHYRRTAWRHAAKRMTAELFPSRTLAELAEKQAIHNEDPMVNVKRMAPHPYAGIADAWFINQQGGLIGMRKTEFEIDGPRLAVKVARTI